MLIDSAAFFHPGAGANLPPEPPDLMGGHGMLWLVNLRTMFGLDPATKPAHVSSAIVHAPEAHPNWHTYFASCVNLDPANDPEPVLWHPSATHELLIFALDPRKPVRLSAPPHMFDGANIAEQFRVPDDWQAHCRVLAALAHIITGRLSPDTDHRAAWRGLFSERDFPELKNRPRATSGDRAPPAG